MNSSKKSFLLHIDSLDILDELTDEEAGALFKAIRSYQKCEELNLTGLVRVAFSPFRNQFIRDNEKYDLTCKRRAEAGSKGGKAKQANASKSKQVVANASKSKQDLANVADSKSKNKSKTNSDSGSDLKPMSAKANDTLEIFNYWKEVMKKNNSSILNAKRDKAIKARLEEGYTVEQIKLAILGCSMTPHNMGQNNNGKRYDDLELICRDGVQIERFASNSNQQPQQRFGQHVSKTLDALNNMEWDDD